MEHFAGGTAGSLRCDNNFLKIITGEQILF